MPSGINVTEVVMRYKRSQKPLHRQIWRYNGSMKVCKIQAAVCTAVHAATAVSKKTNIKLPGSAKSKQTKK